MAFRQICEHHHTAHVWLSYASYRWKRNHLRGRKQERETPRILPVIHRTGYHASDAVPGGRELQGLN